MPIAIASLLVAGCGRTTVRIGGKVTLAGDPVSGAELIFDELGESDEPSFYGISLDDGTYQVDYGDRRGLPAGKYQVTVTWYTLPDGNPLPPGEQGYALKSEGRAVKESVTFERDIAPGSSVVDFELTDAPKT